MTAPPVVVPNIGDEEKKSNKNETENSASTINTTKVKNKREKIDRTHIRVIPGTPEMYKCDLCEKVFRDKKAKCYHDACITGKKPYVCNICERTFVKRSHFEYHERVHTGYKPFKCSLCEKAFPQKNKLNRHMNSHKHEKEYRCEKCGKRYSKRADLSNHASLHTGVRPYICKCCDKSFRLLANLNRHARIHSNERPYACEMCSKSFKDSSLLIRHRKIHGKERPFLCAHCNRHFLSKSELSRHVAVHTDIKPFGCNYCSTIFRRKDNLDRHIRHHHEDKNEQTRASDKETNNKEQRNHREPVNPYETRRVPNNSIKGMKKSSKCYSKATVMATPATVAMSMAAVTVAAKNPSKHQSGPIIISRGNSRDQIISRLDSLGNITPIIRGPGESSNAVPVIMTTAEDKNASIQKRKKTYTYTEPIPLAEAVVINRRIEEKLYPQSATITTTTTTTATTTTTITAATATVTATTTTVTASSSTSTNNYYYFRKSLSDLTMTNNTGPVVLPGNLLVPVITPTSHIFNGKPSMITPAENSDNWKSYKHSNGKYVGGNDREEKIIVESILINDNAHDNNVYEETINTHHWRRRTAESFKSSRPIAD